MGVSAHKGLTHTEPGWPLNSRVGQGFSPDGTGGSSDPPDLLYNR